MTGELIYLCRSSGLVLVVFFTATVVLGLCTAGRTGSPRFVVQALHRSLSALSLGLLLVHLLAPVIAGYLGLQAVYAFVPIWPAPIRIWTRFAALATDLTLLVAVVSVLRVRAGYRRWRAVHATSYLAWALGMVHAIGIGTDRQAVLVCDAVCIVAVVIAGGYRLGVARTAARQRLS
ncbi:MAG TPA: hypothetical protein VHC49_11525 [Mycobacteriales bacterium]|nr:hypothetical protein [Mycobacteriales bacterium]